MLRHRHSGTCITRLAPAKLRGLNEFFQRHESRLRHAAAILAGLLLAAAFPKLGIAGLAWVAPGLLLFSAIGQPAKIAFRLGWLGGLAFNLAALHWLLFIPVTGFPILGWAALSAYCALYPGLWLWLCWRSAPSQPELRQAVPAEHGRPLPSDEMRTRAFVLPNYGQRTVWALQCAVLWVALETVLGCFLTGFPWLALGVSQHKMVPLIQIASCTGVAGVSLLVVWFAAALAGDMVELLRRPERFNKWAMVCLLPLSVALGVFFFGMFATRSSHPTKQGGTPLTLALVQPSIPQTMIWNPAEKTNRFAKLMQLSELALASKPDVLVWPEAALPELSEENFRAVTNLVVQHQVLMVFGADDYELKPGAPRDSQRPADYNFYNSAFLLSREGKVVSTYRKRRLVIFGEYIPLRDWLPFLKWFTPIESGFATGKEPVAFALPVTRAEGDSRPPLRAGMLICFEDVIASAARESAAEADFLLNLTNDGWFGQSSQQFQHAAHSVFRAVENGRPAVRCTNNGLTCTVDAAGFVVEQGVGETSDIYGPGFRIVKLPLPPGGWRQPTFYQQYGDWLGWSCVGMMALLVLRTRRATAA